MNVDIITIGDELLIGQTVNTNAAWIGQQLSLNGMNIARSTTISDTKEEILAAITEAFERSQLIIMTGGLGPTKDDITKETLCEFFDSELELKQDVLKRIESYFAAKGRNLLPANIKQAELPKDCIVLDNHLGTASGMWFKRNGKVLVSMPGVPYEMKALMENEVIPRAVDYFGVKGMYHQTLMTVGIGESALADKIANWEDRIYKDGLSLAYLPSPGIVKLRLTSKRGAEDKQLIDDYFEELENDLPHYVYGKNGITIFEVVSNLLRKKKASLSTVESCTGGLLAHSFVQFQGASDFFQGSFLTYSNELKTALAGVAPLTLENHGAVSEQVVKAMAIGGQKKLDTTYCLAISGVAGPDGGTAEKPVGTVWIALATPSAIIAERFQIGNNRSRNMEIACLLAANMLRKYLINQ
jgi:nicotinamide-nucleotide amidase